MLAENYFLSCFNVEKWLFPFLPWRLWKVIGFLLFVTYEDITVYINFHHLTNLEHCLLINVHCGHAF